jgi:Domain of unknown function (DUF4390)
MMVSTTPCCAKASLAALSVMRWLVLWLAMGGVGIANAAQTSGIEVRKAALTASEEGYTLEAEFDIQLTPLLEDVLHKGVPLYFSLEFEVLRPRWYWTNEKIVSVQQQQRLSFNTLTRQYRVGAGALYQNFPTLVEALAFMNRVRRREDIDPNALRKDSSYAAALRMRLDASQLPKPFQLNTGRDWFIGSEWFRWTVTP